MTTAARPSSCYPLERTSDRPMRPACRIEARIILRHHRQRQHRPPRRARLRHLGAPRLRPHDGRLRHLGAPRLRLHDGRLRHLGASRLRLHGGRLRHLGDAFAALAYHANHTPAPSGGNLGSYGTASTADACATSATPPLRSPTTPTTRPPRAAATSARTAPPPLRTPSPPTSGPGGCAPTAPIGHADLTPAPNRGTNGNVSCTAGGACYSVSRSRTLADATNPRLRRQRLDGARRPHRPHARTEPRHQRQRELHSGRSLLLRLPLSHARQRHLVARPLPAATPRLNAL
jgi:hypothetical protein